MNPLKLGVVVLGALVLQVCLFGQFSYEGARPDVMILLAVVAGFVAGPDRGAVVGFVAGLSIDQLLTTPMGLSALVYALVGYAVGSVSASLVRSAWWITPAVAFAGTAVGVFAYAVVGEVLGQATLQGPALTAIVVLASTVNAALAPLAARALRWARSDDGELRRHSYFAR